MRRTRSLPIVALLFLTVLAVVGCGGEGGGGALPDPRLHFLNASPDSTALNFFVDDDQKGGPLGYLILSAPATAESGDRDITVLEDGTSVQIDGVVMSLQKDSNVIAVALGLENYGTENLKRLRLLVTNVELRAPNGNRSRLFIVHAFNRSPGFQTPPIDFQNPGNFPQVAVADIAPGTSRTTLVDSGPHQFVARRAGTENVYASVSTNLEAGKTYVALVTGIEGRLDGAMPQIQIIPIQ